MERLSRAQNGRFGDGLVDFAGRQAMCSIFGELVVGNHVDDVSLQFQYNNSSNDVVITTTGQGSNSNTLSMGVVAVDAGGVGLSQMRSKDSLRYRPGHEAFCQFTALFEGGGVGLTHFQGPGNGSDRVGFGTDQGIFGCWFEEGGSSTFVSQSEFSIDRIDGTNGEENKSGFNIDLTKLNLYMISFGWLGIAPIMLFVYGGWDKGWVPCHVFDFTNTIDEPHLQNPSLPLLAEVERLSGDGAASIKTSSWRFGVVAGRPEDNLSNRRFGARILDVDGTQGVVGTGIHLFSLKSKATFQSKENHIRAMVDFIISTNEINRTMEFQAYPTPVVESANAGFTAGLTFADVNAENSVMQVATTAVISLDLAGIEPLDVGIVGANAQRANPDVKGFNIFAGDEITFLVPSVTGTGNVSLQADWAEFF